MDRQNVCVSEEFITSIRERANPDREQCCSDLRGFVGIALPVPVQSSDAIAGRESLGGSHHFEPLHQTLVEMHGPVNASVDQILSSEHTLISNESQQSSLVVEDYTVGEEVPRDGCCDAEMNDVPSSSSDQVHIASSLAENSPKVDRANDDQEQGLEMFFEKDSLVEKLANMNGTGYGTHATLKSVLKNFMKQYLVREDFLLDSSQVDVEDDRKLMNMLRELATIDQQEQDIPVKHLVASTLAEDDVAGGESTKLSFLQGLRRKLVHAGPMDAETFFQQFMQQNRAVLGKSFGKQVIISAANVSNRSPETALETEQSLGEDSLKVGNTMLMDHSGFGPNCHNLLISVRGEEETRSFSVGDLVWAKVKSHPWWPGQVFDTADASVPARKTQKPDRVLVAFFGDGTFGWLQQSQLIAFRPNFEDKVQQTTMKSFYRAVSEALLEVSRRVELGLRCAHIKSALYSKDTFPDENVGVRMGVRLYSHSDMSTGREKFHAKRALEFVRRTAYSPSYPLDSGLECAEICGHLYGFRSFIMHLEKSVGNDYAPQRISVARKKVKSAEILNRRVGVKDGPKIEVEKGGKRTYLDTDMAVEKHFYGSRSESPTAPNIIAMESPSSREAEIIRIERKAELCEEATRSDLVAKGKRVQASLEAGGGKRVKKPYSLGPVKDPKASGVNGGAMGFPSPEDDSKTLFDITGYLSVKKKKKKKTRGALKNTSNMSSSSSEKFNESLVVHSDKPSRDKEFDKLRVLEMLPSKIDRLLAEESSNGQPCLKLEGSCEQEGSRDTSLLLDKTSAEESSHGQHCLNLEGASEQEGSRDTSLGIPKKPHTYQSVSAFSKETDDSEELKRGKDHLHVEQDVKGRKKILKKKREAMPVHAEESNNKAKRVKAETTNKGRPKFPRDEEEDMKEAVKSSKPGESIKKLGTPLSRRSADKSSAQRLVPVAGSKLKDARRAELDYGSLTIHTSIAETSTGSFVELLESLQGIARDPVSSADVKSSLHGVTSVFLKFRSMVFLKSAGYGNVGVVRMISSVGNDNHPIQKRWDVNDQSRQPSKSSLATQHAGGSRKAAVKVEPRSDLEYSTAEVLCSVADVETGSSVTPIHSQRVMVESQKPSQELAAKWKNSDDEVLQLACLGQTTVKREPDVSQGTYSSKEAGNGGKIGDPRHISTSVKARAKSFQKGQVSSKAKFVVGIFMQFPEDFTLPSEDELAVKFDRFGLLQTAGVRIHKDSSTAQVVFKHGNDAQAALLHAKQNKLFGHTNVSYKLRHFSLPSRSDSTTASAKYGGSSVKEVKALVSDESRRRAQVIRGLVSGGAEPGAATIATCMTTVDTETSIRNLTATGAGQEGSQLAPHASELHQEGAFQSGSVPPEGSKSAWWQSSPTPQQVVVGSDLTNFPMVSPEIVPPSPSPPPPSPSPPPPPPPPSAAALSLSAPPPPPGDIRDQMLKLLQQVSVLVSSSSLIHRTQ